MDLQFKDRLLSCADCQGEFIFTAGEQLFFHDKQFKNDPKRCKPCKSRRSGLAAAANGSGPAAAGLSRTETRTECSACGVETTVPFKPTQGRPVLCRSCFQLRGRATEAAASHVPSAAETLAQAKHTLAAVVAPVPAMPEYAATLAATAMAAAHSGSSVSSAEEIAFLGLAREDTPDAQAAAIPTELLARESREPLPMALAAATLEAD